MARNIEVTKSGAITWESSDVPVSLEQIRTYVEDQAESTCRWYMQRKALKAWFSRYMRLGAILATSLAALFPIVAQLIPTLPDAAKSGLVPALLVGLAAALLGADKAFGFSTGWIRYISTATSVRGALEEFRLDWALKVSQLGTPPTKEEIAQLIQAAKTFRLAVEGLVVKETHEWAVEFQSTLAQMEKDVSDKFDRLRTQALQEVKDARDKLEQKRLQAEQDAKTKEEALEEKVKAQEEAQRPGSIEIALPNGGLADEQRLQIQMEGDGVSVVDAVAGTARWARIGLKPGFYRIVVSAQKNGKPVNDQAVCEINPGQSLKFEMKLPISAN